MFRNLYFQNFKLVVRYRFSEASSLKYIIKKVRTVIFFIELTYVQQNYVKNKKYCKKRIKDKIGEYVYLQEISNNCYKINVI